MTLASDALWWSDARAHGGTASGRGNVIVAALVVLAVLAYLGRSLVMLTSVIGMAGALWLTCGTSTRHRVVALSVAAVSSSLLAETVHLLYHLTRNDTPDHGGFWVSAVLVGLINAAAMLPVLGLAHLRRRAATSGH